MSNDSRPPAWQPVFSDAVARALAKWPDVPACHGWLALDRRGRWRVAGGPISHPGAIAFLNAHYAVDAEGGWYVQNGPQTAYVDLELAPWIVSVAADGSLSTHTGLPVDTGDDLFVTDQGDVLFTTARGLAAVSDRDLVAFAARFHGADGAQALALLAGLTGDDSVALCDADGRVHRACAITEAALLARFHVVRKPRP